MELPRWDIYFNSIKVRLELYVLRNFYLSQEVFQFHKGTIRTFRGKLKSSEYHLFQFHKGTIRTQAIKNVLDAEYDFNSIKVRLELNLLFLLHLLYPISIP